ncbi:MAG: hypothetical protein FJY36_03525, partial [Betaproteobacteria bacterium]|nr:hypothetical protein [Betaproteobacteria bacterium]
MKHFSIRAQLALSVLALVSLVLVVQLGLQSYAMRKDAVHRIETEEFRILKDFAEDLDEKLQLHLNLLSNESGNVPRVTAANAPALETYLQRQQAMLTMFDDLYVFDAKGVLLVDWPLKPGRRMLDM